MSLFDVGEGDLLLNLILGPVRTAALLIKEADDVGAGKLLGGKPEVPGASKPLWVDPRVPPLMAFGTVPKPEPLTTSAEAKGWAVNEPIDGLAEVAPEQPQPGWFSRNAPLVVGGTALAGALGGGALAYYKSQQDKKKREQAALTGIPAPVEEEKQADWLGRQYSTAHSDAEKWLLNNPHKAEQIGEDLATNMFLTTPGRMGVGAIVGGAAAPTGLGAIVGGAAAPTGYGLQGALRGAGYGLGAGAGAMAGTLLNNVTMDHDDLAPRLLMQAGGAGLGLLGAHKLMGKKPWVADEEKKKKEQAALEKTSAVLAGPFYGRSDSPEFYGTAAGLGGLGGLATSPKSEQVSGVSRGALTGLSGAAGYNLARRLAGTPADEPSLAGLGGGVLLSALTSSGLNQDLDNSKRRKAVRDFENDQIRKYGPEVKAAADPVPEFKFDDPSTYKVPQRIGEVASQPLQWAGKQIGTGANETANPLHGAGEYIKNNPWASAALIGAPIGAGIGLLGGLSNRKKKRNALGDALTGGLLGAGAGALGGGAYQLFRGQEKPVVKPTEEITPAAGVNDNTPFGGAVADTPIERTKDFAFGGSPERAKQDAALAAANKNIYGPAHDAVPESSAYRAPLDEAIARRQRAGEAVAGAEKTNPNWWERNFTNAKPDVEQIERARAERADANKAPALLARSIPPTDPVRIRGDAPAGSPAPNIANPLAGAMGGLVPTSVGLQQFGARDKALQDIGLVPWPREIDTGSWYGRLAAHRRGNNYLGKEHLPENLIADPAKFDAFATDQIPMAHTDNGAAGALGRGTLQNALLTRLGIAGINQTARQVSGGTQNRADVSRLAKGLLQTIEKPPLQAQAAALTAANRPNLLRRILLPGNWDVGGMARSIGNATGLTAPDVPVNKFVGNPGAIGQLAATRATGAPNSPVLPASDITKELRSGKLSPMTLNAVRDLAAGTKDVGNGKQVLVGNRVVDPAQIVKPGDLKSLAGPNGALGPVKFVSGGVELPKAKPGLRPLSPANVSSLGLGALTAGADRAVRGKNQYETLLENLLGSKKPITPAGVAKDLGNVDVLPRKPLLRPDLSVPPPRWMLPR